MNPFEVIFALLLLVLALVLFFRNLKTKSGGVGNCGTCSAKCPSRDTGAGCDEIVFLPKKN
ncbi:MAG: hypothetical protein WAV55_05005 [Clostridiaceae bacterium]